MIVTAVPAWIVPPVGAVMGLGGDCAVAKAASAEMMIASSFMFVDVGTDALKCAAAAL